MAFTIYSVQLMDKTSNKLLQTAGGAFIVVAAGSLLKASLINPLTQASLTNPVTPTNGKISFAINHTTPLESSVDLYGITADGRAVMARGITSAHQEIWVDGNRQHQVLVLPVHISNYPQNVETNTGIDLLTGSLVLPDLAVKVVVADPTETLDVGLLSTQTGGDADGFLAAIDVGTVGTVAAKAATTPTKGALIRETIPADAGTASIPKAYVIGSTAKTISVTTSPGSDTVQAFVQIPYMMPMS
jgi:hypothetical protein